MELSEENISKMLEDIPTFSQSVIRILELTADIDSSPKDLVAQVSHDPILTAKLLKVVNSAYFGLSRKVDSIQQSVVYVGINTIKNLAISAAAMGSLPRTNKAGLNMEDFWSHSVVTAVVTKLLAEKLAVPKTDQAAYFISGLLHDIGQLIFSQAQPEAYLEILAEANKMQRPLHEIEQEVFGIDHAALGALLAERWQLSQNMVDAIRYHHEPLLDDNMAAMNWLVFVANQVSKTVTEDEIQISMASPLPEKILGLLETPFDELADSLPNIEEEIENAKVFVQLTAS